MIARGLLGLASLALFAGLAWAVLGLPAPTGGLATPALERLTESGVANPVTAVLLNYRGYDTLLEVAVLLLAIAGVWAMRRGEWPVGDRSGRPLLNALLRLLLPVLVLASAYVLWLGAFAPGGAFQGGALLGGALVLLMLGGIGRRTLRREGWVRAGLLAGVVVFGLAALAGLLLTGGLLQYPAGQAGLWITIIEAAAMISIGLTLGLLYLGGRMEGEA